MIQSASRMKKKKRKKKKNFHKIHGKDNEKDYKKNERDGMEMER